MSLEGLCILNPSKRGMWDQLIKADAWWQPMTTTVSSALAVRLCYQNQMRKPIWYSWSTGTKFPSKPLGLGGFYSWDTFHTRHGQWIKRNLQQIHVYIILCFLFVKPEAEYLLAHILSNLPRAQHGGNWSIGLINNENGMQSGFVISPIAKK